MDKKIINGGIIAIAALGIAVVYRKWFKTIKKQIETEENERNAELEQLGVSPEKLEQEVDPVEDGNDMVKALAVGTMFNPNWDYDIVDPELALNADHIISVTQEIFKGSKGENTDLVFYFDIPNYLSGGYKSPKIGDYIKGFKEAIEHAWTNIVRYCPKPKGKLIGMVSVTYTDPEDPEEEVSERVEINDPKIYEELADEYHDGLAAFYEGVVNKCLPESVNDKFSDWVDSKWDREKLENFTINEVQLVYRASFKMQDRNGIGINYKTALETLKYFTDELSISRKGSAEVKYENVLFCAPSKKTGVHELTSFYYRADDNSIKVNSFSY
jgi:hypothetical protein